MRRFFHWWPRTLMWRLSLIFLIGLLLANTLTFGLMIFERMESAKSVMLGNLEYDVATSVAILDRLPAAERADWLNRLNRGNYRYLLQPGQPGNYPVSRASKEAAQSIQTALGGHYQLQINSVADSHEHMQVHLRLHDGSPLTIDLTPRLAPFSHWLPVVLTLQLLLLLACSWFAVRLAVRPLTRLKDAADTLDLQMSTPLRLTEDGPLEVAHAAKAFNAMQDRILTYVKERIHILASISHDLQTPITRMKLRSELMDDGPVKEKLLLDLHEISQLVREGVAYARTSESVAEQPRRIAIDAFIDSLVCDYQDMGQAVSLEGSLEQTVVTRPQALRRLLTNLIDNALKFAGQAEVQLLLLADKQLCIRVCDRGPGVPEEELEAILQPFYRLETSRNRETGGTGLGLAIAQQLTLALGATMTLSHREGGGLCVSIVMTNLSEAPQ